MNEYIIIAQKVSKIEGGIKAETKLIKTSGELSEDFLDDLWNDCGIEDIDKIETIDYIEELYDLLNW